MNNPVPHDEQCDRCETKAIVGWGSKPTWLCLEHFQEELHGARGRVLSAIEASARGLIG